MPDGTGRLATWPAWLIGCLLAPTPVSAAAECGPQSVSWELAQVVQRSDWRELDLAERTLVHESGSLSGPELAFVWRCNNWGLGAQLSELAGSRRYDGQTSTGVPVSSRTALSQRQAQFQADLWLSDAWQVAGRLTQLSLWRDIASARGATGYPERFDWHLFSAGVVWHTAPGPSQFKVGAWVAMPLASSLTLQLPGRDPASLPLGDLRQFELQLGWRVQLSPGWHAQLDAGYRRTDIAMGASQVITRNGVPVGVAHQPQTRLINRPIAVGVNYAY